MPGNASVFVTASHVASMCLGGTMGANDASVAILRDDVAHDVALLQENDGGPPVVTRALRINAAPAHLGEPVALIGYSGRTGAIGKVPRVLLALHGTVVATDHLQALVSPQGLRETLSDTIVVSAAGAEPGISGGPAIDTAGRVIGVIEGSGHGLVFVTPAQHISGP